MRKELLLMLGLLLLMPLSSAVTLIAGNDNVVQSFDKCSELFVNVSGSLDIHPDEYELLGCYELENDSWYCNCSNNYDLVMRLNLRAMNTYEFNMTYYYEEPITRRRSSGSRYYYYIFENVTEEPLPEPVRPEPPVIPPVEPEPESIYNETLTEEEEEVVIEEPVIEEEASRSWLWYALWFVFILFVAWWFLVYKKEKKNEDG
jgi:hypothetical protein